MAEPIRCDWTDAQPHLADVIVSRISGGPIETTAWCNDHYLAVCLAVVQAAAEAEAATDAEATARLEAVGAPDPSGSEPSSAEAPVGPGEPTNDGDAAETADQDQQPPDDGSAVLDDPGGAGEAEAAEPAEV